LSFLTPLYILGALTIAAPIIFHLIRRAPQGEVPFSSLMFLSPTPPRLTRRSRLDNLLLLVLRGLVLALLALAFARPFLRQAARLDFGTVERQRIAILVDTSASMRRGDLWPKAKALAETAIKGCRPSDQWALFSFDTSARPQLAFAESATLEPSKRQTIAQARLASLAPTWRGTHLGQALIDAVSAVEDVADATEKAAKMPRKVVLITDLQQGSHLDVLGEFQWPSDVELELKTVSDPDANAGMQWLAPSTEADQPEADQAPRVRVSNDPGSRRESFALHWVDAKGTQAGKPIDVYVPPGESRVVRVPRIANAPPSPALRLEGDGETFDNMLWLAADRKEEATVVYLGANAEDDTNGLLYYLERVFLPTPRRTIQVKPLASTAPLIWEPGRPPALVIVTSAETSPENVRRLKNYTERGGTVLGVITNADNGGPLAAIAGAAAWKITDAPASRDVMLGEIAFDHPLFASFVGAQFNDFTKIHFWKYRRIDSQALGEVRVLARFENGDPAVLEKAVGKGKLVLLTSSWIPSDSQLARSSKFVPLMASLLESGLPKTLDTTNYQVDDAVPLPTNAPAAGWVVHKPDGATVRPAQGSSSFAETDQPGVYTLDAPEGKRTFAVNLDPNESKAAPLSVETLEQLGCRLANQPPKALDREHQRQMQNAELEGRQKVWRWLIIGAVGLLIVETWLAGRLSRPQLAHAEVLAT